LLTNLFFFLLSFVKEFVCGKQSIVLLEVVQQLWTANQQNLNRNLNLSIWGLAVALGISGLVLHQFYKQWKLPFLENPATFL
jgi:hypothetical protein